MSSFINELREINNTNIIPDKFLNLIKDVVVQNAKSYCDSVMSEIKKCVQKGNTHTVNGKTYANASKNLYSFTKYGCLNSELHDYLTKVANQSLKNKYQISYRDCDGWQFDFFPAEDTSTFFMRESFLGYKNVYYFRIRKNLYTDLFFNTIRNTLRSNDIEYTIKLSFFEKFSMQKVKCVKSIDITNNFPDISENFSGTIGDRTKASTFYYTYIIEAKAFF